MEYGPHGRDERILGSVADLPDCRGADDGKIRWIEFNGLGDIAALKAISEKFGLHPLAIEDVLNVGQRPKLEAYAGHLFIIAQMIYHDAERTLCGEQVSMFVCGNFLISVQEDAETDVFDPVRQRT